MSDVGPGGIVNGTHPDMSYIRCSIYYSADMISHIWTLRCRYHVVYTNSNSFSPMSTFYIRDIYTDVYILHRKERIRFSIYYMGPTSKCLDVGDHIFAVVYTTSYVRQIWVGAVYYTARTYIGHEDRSSVPPPYTPSLLPPLHPLSTPNIYALKKKMFN